MRAPRFAGGAALAAALVVTGAGPASAAPTVRRAIEFAAPGRLVLTLDGPTYESARPDLGDLRVVDDRGSVVPYLLERVEEEPPAAPLHATIRNRAFVRGQRAQAELELGGPTLKSELTLSLSGDNFRRRVIVEGRGRRGEPWVTLTDSAYAFAVPGPTAARYETVPLPENNFPTLRVTVEHGPDDPERIEILDAWTRPATRRRPRETALAPHVSRAEDPKAHETVLTLDLGARWRPFRGIALDVADPAFFRGVTVERRLDPLPVPSGEPAPPLRWEPLGEAAVYRYDVGGSSRECLRLDVSGRARVLRVRIKNRDDAALAVRGVTAFVPVERLAFEAAPGRSYELRYGDAAATAPEYDLVRTAGDPALWAARAADARLLAPVVLAEAAPPPPPWTERHPALLWGGLVAIVGALGAVTWRALRAAG